MGEVEPPALLLVARTLGSCTGGGGGGSTVERWLYITTAFLDSDLGDAFVCTLPPCNNKLTHDAQSSLPPPPLGRL